MRARRHRRPPTTTSAALAAALACVVGCGAGALDRLADEPLVMGTGTLASTAATSATTVPASATARDGDAGAKRASPLLDGTAWTQSPWPASAADAEPRARELARACGEPDGGLERVARAVAATRAKGLGAPDADRVATLLRNAGVPHVRPRLLAVSGRAPLEASEARARVGSLQTPLARCGVAIATTPHGGEVLVAIAVDALADLAPLPVRAEPGEWLTMEAKLHVATRGARVLVTGSRGLPRTVPTALDARTGIVRARFALEKPGAFVVQLVGDVEGGPRPLLEAKVATTGAAVEADDEDAPAPGEDAAAPDDAASLERMVNALRASEGLAPLAHDTRLDVLARAHAEQMAKEGLVAHDLGDGDLRARAISANVVARRIGENVARAATLARAHRALHASPSHRLNLLDAQYTRLGLGVRRGEDGSLYVCEVFGSD